MISMSGAFSVTFSVIFAYVADVTDERERSTAYGLVRTVEWVTPLTPNSDFCSITNRSSDSPRCPPHSQPAW